MTEVKQAFHPDGQDVAAMQFLEQQTQAGGTDLHLHTTASDGSDAPEVMLQRVLAAGLKSFAITDHDTLGAIETVRRGLCRQPKSRRPIFIPGVELSVEMQQDVHLLGYFPFGGEEQLADFFALQRTRRIARNQLLIRRLNELGFPIREEQLRLDDTEPSLVGRVHVAQWLVKHGYYASVADAFKHLLGAGKPGYVQRERSTLAEGVRAIRQAGGAAVLAHPHLYGWVSELKPQQTLVPPLLIESLALARKQGVQGVEAWHGTATAHQRDAISAAARYLGLARTAGSDDHGALVGRDTLYGGAQQFWPAREILVTGALIRETTDSGSGDAAWLLARRAPGLSWAGYWELPGGKVEDGESAADALLREIQEELETTATLGKQRLLLWHDYPKTPHSPAIRVVLACLEAKLDGPLPARPQAHDAFKICTAAEALALPLLPADEQLFQILGERHAGQA